MHSHRIFLIFLFCIRQDFDKFFLGFVFISCLLELLTTFSCGLRTISILFVLLFLDIQIFKIKIFKFFFQCLPLLLFFDKTYRIFRLLFHKLIVKIALPIDLTWFIGRPYLSIFQFLPIEIYQPRVI